MVGMRVGGLLKRLWVQSKASVSIGKGSRTTHHSPSTPLTSATSQQASKPSTTQMKQIIVAALMLAQTVKIAVITLQGVTSPSTKYTGA